MIYQQDGSCGCLFDPGMLGSETLSERQATLIGGADLLCVTVGPPGIAREALALIGSECKVAWVMKNDPLSYPKDLRVALAARADYIFCNRQERAWVDEGLEAARSHRDPMIVVTSGGEAVAAQHNGTSVRVDVEPLAFDDPSGAGDTLAGGCLAAMIAGEQDLRSIVASGINAAASLLRGRSYG